MDICQCLKANGSQCIYKVKYGSYCGVHKNCKNPVKHKIISITKPTKPISIMPVKPVMSISITKPTSTSVTKKGEAMKIKIKKPFLGTGSIDSDLDKKLINLSQSMETKVVNVKVKYIRPKYKDLEDWMNNPDNVYIARRGVVFITDPETGSKKRYPPKDSIWANPYKVGKDGTRDEVVEKYRIYIKDKFPDLKSMLTELKGKNLGCWCRTEQAIEKCHGDVLVDLINDIESNMSKMSLDGR